MSSFMYTFTDLETEYKEHKIFDVLSELWEFYDYLFDSVAPFANAGTVFPLNIDCFVFSSIKRTLESIKMVLSNGCVNDGYSLLRKYYDVTIINVYTQLFLEEHSTIEHFMVDSIDNWVEGTEKLPPFRTMSRYIRESERLKPITELLFKDKLYQEIRNRCNDYTHYNSYRSLILNNKEAYCPNRVKVLDIILDDLVDIFVQHFACIFYLHDKYMMNTEYVDLVSMCFSPEEDSLYWVPPFIQDAFDRWIKPRRPDIAEEMKSKTCMNLE